MTAVAKAAPPAGPEVTGAGGFVPTAAVPPPTQPAGADGVANYGGFVVSNERDPRLTGNQKWITYDNATLNVAIIASAINVWTQLAGSAKWTAEPNKRGGDAALLMADLLTEGLIEAPLSTPWRAVVRRQSMKKFRGFALHEVTVRRRSDSAIVVADIQDRPQWTVYRWNRPDPRAPWIGIEQQTQVATSGGPYYIPRDRLFYSVENTLSSSPEGVGILRQLSEAVRVLELYKQWEGIGFQTDLRGVPIARAPLSAIKAGLGNKSDVEAKAMVQERVRFLTDFLSAHNKRSDQGILLDSAPYFNKDAAQSPSGSPQWGFELVTGGASSVAEINTAIMREVRDIARVMCAEWLLLGGEDSGGAYSMHEDKTAMFGLLVNAVLDDIGDDATRDIATRLTALNGFDPETCTPRLVPEPVASGAVIQACQALASLASAGLAPNDPARNVIRARLNLPPEPEPMPELFGALPGEDLDGDGVPDEDANANGVPDAVEGAPTEEQPGAPGNPHADEGLTKRELHELEILKQRYGADDGDEDLEFEDGDDGDDGLDDDDESEADADIEKYNPDQNRDERGRFSSGGGSGARGRDSSSTSRSRTAAQRSVERHAARVEALGTKLKEAKQARRTALSEARAVLRSAKTADTKAQKKPTAANRRAAKAAATAARRASARLDRHDAAIARHQAKHEEAKQKLKDAKAALRGSRAVGAARLSSMEHTDEHLATIVNRTVASIPEQDMIGDGAFVSDVYDSMPDRDRKKFGSLDDFKGKLTRLRVGGHVDLHRADGVGAMSDEKVRRSEIEHIPGIAHHFVRDRKRSKGFNA